MPACNRFQHVINSSNKRHHKFEVFNDQKTRAHRHTVRSVVREPSLIRTWRFPWSSLLPRRLCLSHWICWSWHRHWVCVEGLHREYMFEGHGIHPRWLGRKMVVLWGWPTLVYSQRIFNKSGVKIPDIGFKCNK